jgi:Leucine-rich repeat (LRR) protein
MLNRLLSVVVIPLSLMLGACQGYDFTVNEKVVYAPKPLFRDYITPDAGLNSCLEQTINDGVITNAQQLTELDCSFAGIENLEGLSVFNALVTLRLSSNNILNLLELTKLTALETLVLDNNQIVDPVPLDQLASLRQLDLSGNPALQCPRPGSLAQVTTLTLPKHCR